MEQLVLLTSDHVRCFDFIFRFNSFAPEVSDDVREVPLRTLLEGTQSGYFPAHSFVQRSPTGPPIRSPNVERNPLSRSFRRSGPLAHEHDDGPAAKMATPQLKRDRSGSRTDPSAHPPRPTGSNQRLQVVSLAWDTTHRCEHPAPSDETETLLRWLDQSS